MEEESEMMPVEGKLKEPNEAQRSIEWIWVFL